VAATPAPQAAPAVAQEETLFERMEEPAQPAAFQPRAEPAPAPQAVADDVPPPAYTPRPEPIVQEAENFTAPRAPAPGTPSPEALARLQAAVNRVPKATDAAPQQQPQAAAPTPHAEAEKPRFGINSLINRMTGAQAESGAPQQTRTQPQVTALRDEPEAAEDQEKIEIPAFLRRQAN